MKEAMNVKVFDVVVYLDSEEAIAEYMKAVQEENDPELSLAAVNDVARARAMITRTEISV